MLLRRRNGLILLPGGEMGETMKAQIKITLSTFLRSFLASTLTFALCSSGGVRMFYRQKILELPNWHLFFPCLGFNGRQLYGRCPYAVAVIKIHHCFPLLFYCITVSDHCAPFPVVATPSYSDPRAALATTGS